ncbi:paraquat-inducible protein A [Aquirhabdus sp.]|uniref:paraquat-inducible protein A n=1 Tax=Aquirhabdus sp. TaxID=2824160 RepID=UPI00396CF4BB
MTIAKPDLKSSDDSSPEQIDFERQHFYTAKDLSLISCHSCGHLNALTENGKHCERCHAVLHIRKPASLDRTWALMLAAVIMYIPANLLPMTRTDSLLGSQEDTIMSGVIYFWQSNDYLVASVIFVASIFVPMLKLMILTFLLIAVRRQSSNKKRWRPEQCAVLYRIVEFIGRWSMIDVFVVSLLTALIQMQSLATISAGPGAVAFGAVVVLTMLASLSFDPRIIWDNYYRHATPVALPNSTSLD